MKQVLRRALLIVTLAVLAESGWFGCTSLHSKTDDKASGAPKVKAVLHLDTFVVNLADPQDNRFLRVGIELGLEKALPAKGEKGEEGALPMARIRDAILTVLMTWHSDALLGPDGKQKLKDELVRALHDRVPELGVKEVYFTDFLVQR